MAVAMAANLVDKSVAAKVASLAGMMVAHLVDTLVAAKIESLAGMMAATTAPLAVVS